jgi:hypothetical protein
MDVSQELLSPKYHFAGMTCLWLPQFKETFLMFTSRTLHAKQSQVMENKLVKTGLRTIHLSNQRQESSAEGF